VKFFIYTHRHAWQHKFHVYNIHIRIVIFILFFTFFLAVCLNISWKKVFLFSFVLLLFSPSLASLSLIFSNPRSSFLFSAGLINLTCVCQVNKCMQHITKTTEHNNIVSSSHSHSLVCYIHHEHLWHTKKEKYEIYFNFSIIFHSHVVSPIKTAQKIKELCDVVEGICNLL
jgi:hypothetical protein